MEQMIFKGRNQIPYSWGRYGYTRYDGTVWHGGQDIVGLDDNTVRAVEGGKVLQSTIVTNKANLTWEWGNYVMIQTASDERHIYAHLAERLVQAGETVTAGQPIGVMGNTGNAADGYKHVHFERRKSDGRTAIDPSVKSGCANRVGTYGAQLIAPLSADACVINVGPASAGDVNIMQALAEVLGLSFHVDNGMMAIGPMTPGDQIAILTKATELQLPTAAATWEKEIEINTDILRVRTGPGVEEYKQVGEVKRGQHYKVVDTAKNWFYIETDGLDGWVCGDYVKAL